MNPPSKDRLSVVRRVYNAAWWTCVIAAGIYVFGGAFLLEGFRIRRSENRLQSRKDYGLIAGACAGLIKQLGTNESQQFSGNDAALPEAIRQLKPAYVGAYTNQVKIVFGGGHHHWGLFYGDIAVPSQGSILEFWSDGHQSKKLWP